MAFGGDPVRHSYAKQRLFELGNKIFISGEQILVPFNKAAYHIYDIKPLKTHIKSNSELMEEGEIKRIDYNDLNRMGWMLVSERVGSGKNRYFVQQSVVYKLKRYNAHIPSNKGMPNNHYVEYDELNQRIRLVGRNSGPLGYGHWQSLEVRGVDKKERYLDAAKDTQQLKRMILSRYMDLEETPDIINIPEVPVMISAQGEVVCLENSRDEPVICIAGARGAGKTMLAHSIIDHAYWKKPNFRMAILNDSLYQTMQWTLPCDREENDGGKPLSTIFAKGIQRIGEHPLPLPLVFLHPNTDTLKETVLPNEKVSFNTSIPFEHVIQNYSYFFSGKKEWQLGKSAPYFRNIKDDLLGCKNLDEIEEVLNVAVEEDKLNKQSKDKIFSVLIDIFNQKILDINTKIPAYWKTSIRNNETKERELNPVLSVMEAGLIPVVMTQNLQPKDYFPQYMRYFIDSIFEYQVEVAKYRDETTWMFIDELRDISSTENRTVAAESLRRCVTEGRNPRLGTIFTIQNWTKVDPLIRNNTTHLFSYINLSAETKEIAKDFALPTHIEKDIITLPKFRLIGMTHEKFVCYTSEGERYTTSEPIKGMAVMPLSAHQAPGNTGESDEEEEE